METLKLDQLLKKFTKENLSAQKNIIIVDIREADEYQHEHIQGAKNIPLKQLATLSPNDCHDKTVVFHCRSGNRTEINQAILEKTPLKTHYCLAGGINAWKAAGLPLQKQISAPIDIMRQVQLIVGIMILFGILLNYLVSPYFILLPVVAGVGLLLAGTTGFCGMASLLKHMPWNKTKTQGGRDDF